VSAKGTSITLNGRTYRWPERPVVVVCVDGCEPEYITRAVAASPRPTASALSPNRSYSSRIFDSRNTS